MNPTTTFTDSHDERLIADLGRLLARVDPIPAPVAIAAHAAIEWRTLDAELAQLIHDSAVDEALLCVRGVAEARIATFEAGELVIEIEAEPDHEGRALRVVGQLIPEQPATVTVLHGEDLVVARADAL